MLPAPSQTQRTVKLADWLELMALASDGSQASFGTLERVLNRGGTYETALVAQDDGDQPTVSAPSVFVDEAVESAIESVADELEARAIAAGVAYPFELGAGSITLKGPWGEFVPYLFCLCLSYFGDPSQPAISNVEDDDDELAEDEASHLFPRRLFEHLCALAAGNYLGGQSIRFGWPRRGLATRFADAVESLSIEHLREGKGFSGSSAAADKKDGHLDIVAWKDFPDGAQSKLVIFGQCATNKDPQWEPKVHELRPSSFWRTWIAGHFTNDIQSAFFIPHRVDTGRWLEHANSAGLLFDRCRIAAFAFSDINISITHEDEDIANCRAWIGERIDEAKE